MKDTENWEETSLRNARLKKSARVLLTTGNNLIRNGRILQVVMWMKFITFIQLGDFLD